MIAHLVQHDQYVALLRIDELLKPVQHALVAAFHLVADGVQLRGRKFS